MRTILGSTVYGDGPTGITDFNLDGNVDIIVNTGSRLYVWDPVNEKIVVEWTRSGRAIGLPIVANIYNDDLADDNLENNSIVDVPEVTVLVGSTLTCYNIYSNTPIWTLSTTDGSAATSLTSFDFNGDGFQELVYRDVSQLRIMYGGPASFTPTGVDANRNYEIFACSSQTGWEHPVVADTDNDGQAEILVACNPQICIYESASAPWQPARSIWNQFSYNAVNINDDGTVPATQQDILAPFPGPGGDQILNSFGNQINTVRTRLQADTVALADASVNIDSIVGNCPEVELHFNISNSGSTFYAANTPAAVYSGNPEMPGATLLHTFSTADQVSIDSTTSFTENLVLPNSITFPVDIYLVLNDTGHVNTTLDFSNAFPVTNISECNFSNNVSSISITNTDCTDKDMDGVPDFADIDNDNDGILDENEQSCSTVPVPFVLTNPSAVPLITIDGTIANVVSSVANPSNQVAGDANGNLNMSNASGLTDLTTYTLTFDQDVVFVIGSKLGTAGSFIEINEDWIVSSPGATFEVSDPDGDLLNEDGETASNSLLFKTSNPANTNPANDAWTITSSPLRTITISYNNPINNPNGGRIRIYATCIHEDTDNDGIVDFLDLDSDNDGCPDAQEGGAFFASTQIANDTLIGGIQANGVPTIAGTGQSVNFAQDSLSNSCIDTDMDGVPDVADIDDDNDGVLDIDEQF